MSIADFIFSKTKYHIEAGNITPYYRAKLIGNDYHIYEGVLGNRYNFYKVPIESIAGNAYRIFNKKYNIDNTFSHTMNEDIQKVNELCIKQAKETKTGIDAYLKYWNEYPTESDKKTFKFCVIPFFEALKEWYNLKLEDHIKQNEHLYPNNEVKGISITQWQEMTFESVGSYLKNSEKRVVYGRSAISADHAIELNKFYEWIKQELQADAAKIEEEKASTSPANDPTSKDTKQITHMMIALIYIYKREQITRGNGNEIAAKFGFINKTSGESIFQDYTLLATTSNRLLQSEPPTKKIIKNRIKLFQTTANYLAGEPKERIIAEIKLLNIKLKTMEDESF